MTSPRISLSALRGMEKAATPGPWATHYCIFADPTGKYKEGGACGIDPMGPFDCSRDECHHPLEPTDADLIAALRNAAPALIEYVEAGEALAALNEKEYTTAEWDAAIERVGAARVPFREVSG